MKYFIIASLIFVGLGIANQSEAAVFYVDFQCGDVAGSCGNGTATTTPFSSLDQFTEVARSAGDIAFVRRGVASTTGISDLNFTSDGTIANPIKISADYDNLWNGFASSTQTYTVAVATSTFTASADQSEIIVGEWVYVDGDCAETYNSTVLNQCEFAYEVASVASTSIGFYLPYKGNQTGAGHTLRILSQTTLGSNPQWNVASGDFQWNFDGDTNWLIKGLDIRGTDVNGIVEIDGTSLNQVFIDTIFIGNGSGDLGINPNMLNAEEKFFIISKSRFFNLDTAIQPDNSLYYIYDSILDGNKITSSQGIDMNGGFTSPFNVGYIFDTVIRNYTTAITGGEGGIVYTRNLKTQGNTSDIDGTQNLGFIFLEDFNFIGNNQQYPLILNNINNQPILQSTTTIIRVGGGGTSIVTTPSTNISSLSKLSTLKLFEYPIYTNTTSRQYDVYFRSTSTAAWTANPTASELWVECEYWAHATGATSTRKILKSTGTLPFTTDETNWNALSVTCVPTQTGILYLKGWYAKTKESGGMNEFFIDGTPVITP